jgi:hypothetical protein
VDLANAGPHTAQAGRESSGGKSWVSLNFFVETPVVDGIARQPAAFEEIVI